MSSPGVLAGGQLTNCPHPVSHEVPSLFGHCLYRIVTGVEPTEEIHLLTHAVGPQRPAR